jgi:hypothetical protein
MRALVPRLVAFTEELCFGRSDVDQRVRAARLAGALSIGGGLVVLATMWVLPPEVHRLLLALTATVALVAGFVVRRLPWQRWPAGATWVLPIGALVGLAIAGRIGPDSVRPYLALSAFVSVFVG